MSFLYYLVLLVHVAACLFLIAVVLLQQGKGQDLASAFGGGGSQTAFGPRGSATVLSRATTILAAVFMVTSMGLSLVKPHASGILDQVPTAVATPKPAASAPAATVPGATVPAAPAGTAPAASTSTEPGSPAKPAEAPAQRQAQPPASQPPQK